MHLNDHQDFSQLDTQDMLADIHALPAQLDQAWKLRKELPLNLTENINQVVIAGMGGSAIGASLLQAYVAPHCNAPIFVFRDYTLPAWVKGKETLVIASSHSGNTEETLSAFEDGVQKGCSVMGISTNGNLAEKCREKQVPLWLFEHQGQPRAAVGFSFALLLGVLHRLNLIPDPTSEIQDAVSSMKQQQEQLRAKIAVPANPAKRYAGQLVDRWVSVFGAGFMSPVARRWKGQINELAKAWAQFEALPEANHNTLAGVLNPGDALTKTMTLFLRAEANHPRNKRRINLTKKHFMLEGLNTDFVNAAGESRLAQQWTTLHFGDYVAYYLAMLYDMDPTPVTAIDNLKAELDT